MTNKALSANYSLSAQYTKEELQEADHFFSDELEKAINDEVINEVAGPTLIDDGWIYINVPNSSIDEAAEWINENATGKFHCWGGHFYFNKQSDATMFILKWK